MKRKYLIIILTVALIFTAGCRGAKNSNKQKAGSIRIASFNIRIFSSNSRDDEELGYIADIMEKYDVIAIQELRDEEVLKRTVLMLENRGKEYEYEISDKVGRRVKERYAFLYRKGNVKKVKGGRLYEEENDEFIREPFYATFKAENFDFTLITIHVLYGSSKAERRPEIRELARVYQRIQDEDPTEQDIIILGDLNFPPTDEGFDNLKDIQTMTFLFAPPLKTTITDRSLYDNFWFQEEYVTEYSAESGIDSFDETMFNNDDDKARLAVSDHRPVWAKFYTSGPDDDMLFSYLKANLLLILGIAGAVISFLIFSLEKVARKQKLRLSLILAALGFLILTGQQVITDLDKKNSNRLREARTMILTEIKKKVRKTLTIVEQLREVLTGKSPEQIGIEVVQRTETNRSLASRPKGSVAEWPGYADWLESFKGQEKTIPCLSLTINAGNRYDVHLLLAYLFTNSETRSYFEGLHQSKWLSFPDFSFINSYAFPEPDTKYVLFYDGESGNLIGYADAQLFAAELFRYERAGKARLVERALNRKHPTFMATMKEWFKTFKRDVTEGKDAYMAAKHMLERKINEMVSTYEGKLYLVSLSKIVKIVS